MSIVNIIDRDIKQLEEKKKKVIADEKKRIADDEAFKKEDARLLKETQKALDKEIRDAFDKFGPPAEPRVYCPVCSGRDNDISRGYTVTHPGGTEFRRNVFLGPVLVLLRKQSDAIICPMCGKRYREF